MKKKLQDKLLIFKDEKYDLKNTIYMLLLIMVISAFFGFIYETFFYRIDLGYFVKRGSTFGPWIPIYAFGGLAITLFTYRLKKHTLLVFVINCIVTGILEYATGLVFWECFHKRLWDYNVEIWNFGNINGYICLRSVLFFGLSSLFLIYGIIPILKKVKVKMPEKNLAIISCILGLLFFIDMIAYMILK